MDSMDDDVYLSRQFQDMQAAMIVDDSLFPFLLPAPHIQQPIYSDWQSLYLGLE